MITPRARAPFAKARVVSTGFVTPSPGRCTPPTTSSTLARGTISLTSPAVITFTASPKTRAIEAPRLSSSNRASVVATLTEPRCWNPVAWPVSASRVAKSSVVYWARRVRLWVARSWPTRPAACQVVPLVSSDRSSSTTSVTPRRAR
ncbi:unannotated protein [freshwater metagenome]|uniref:Unannotated protein n=1 Tax=freshwater metagenome TaxID=449393 RepID=A0A6J7J918_9ZZZZ